MNTPIDSLLAEVSCKDAKTFTILTANQRQSRALRRYFSAGQLSAYELPQICTLNEWVFSLWERLQLEMTEGFDPTILSSVQTQWVWKQCLRKQQLPPLLDASTLAKQLFDAEEIEEQYLIDVSSWDDGLTEEAEFYQQLKQQKNALLLERQCVTQSQAVLRLIEHFKHTALEYPVYVYGFVEVPPLYCKLIETASGSVTFVAEKDQNQDVDRVCVTSKHDEINLAIAWAKNTLVAHPKESVAVVVPDLHVNFREIRRRFFKALESDHYLAGGQPLHESFDVSVAEPLSDTAIVSDAIALLLPLDRRIPKDKARQLLTSPYWGIEDASLRHMLASQLHRRTEDEIPISTFLNLFSRAEAEASALLVHMTKIRSKQSDTRGFKFPSEWVDWYIGLLDVAGWPGSKSLSSREYQTVQTFLSALNTICDFDHSQRSQITFSDFKHILVDVCGAQNAQMEVKHPQIRILGLMEAAGQQFDHCLIIGLTDSALPQKSNPNAFLPIQLQKQANTPRSSFERELSYARDLMRSIKSGTKHLVLSRHKFDGEQEKPPSPLLNSMFHQNEREISETEIELDGFDKLVAEKLGFTQFDDIDIGNAPSIPEGSAISGGVAHINAYWNNPLFAFFKFRLNVDQEIMPSIGLSPIARGNLVHQVLQSIYSEYASRDALLQFLNKEELTEDLANRINEAWRGLWPETRSIALALEQHEKQKTTRILTQYLQMDAERSQSFKVERNEHKHELRIADHSIHLRIDRIDQDESGRRIIFDYKTGKTQLNGVSKMATTDFQLPLYAICYRELNVAAVAYIEINDKTINFTGVGAEEIKIPGVQSPSKIRNSELPATWPETIDHWHNNALHLINDLTSGTAHYLPRNKSTAAFTEYFERAVRAEERDALHD